METVQIKDNCWTCLGMNPKCEICQGTGEVISWITFEELLIKLLELKELNDDRNKQPESQQTSFFESMNSMERPPNPNI